MFITRGMVARCVNTRKFYSNRNWFIAPMRHRFAEVGSWGSQALQYLLGGF